MTKNSFVVEVTFKKLLIQSELSLNEMNEA